MVSYNELLITRRLRLKELRDSSYGLARRVVERGAAWVVPDPAAIEACKVYWRDSIPVHASVLAMHATYISPQDGVSYELSESPNQ